MQRAFERKAGGALPGALHWARATHGYPRKRAPGAERTGIQAECYPRQNLHGLYLVADVQGVHDGRADIDRIPIRHSKPGAGVVCTVGIVNVEPKIVTAVPGVCEISLDQRALDATVLAAMLREAHQISERVARENNVGVEWKPLWRIEPRLFDTTLVRLCEEAVREETGDAP